MHGTTPLVRQFSDGADEVGETLLRTDSTVPKVINFEGGANDPQRHVSPKAHTSRAGPTTFAVIVDGMLHGRETGLYCCDARILSHLLFKINNKRPVITGIRQDELQTHLQFLFQVPNASIEGSIDYTLGEGDLLSRLRLKNTGNTTMIIPVNVSAKADHFDTFHVRFSRRPEERGRLHPSLRDLYGKNFPYSSVDEKDLRSFLRFSEKPKHRTNGSMQFDLTLRPGEEREIIMRAGIYEEIPNAAMWETARLALEEERRQAFVNCARIESTNPRLGRWLNQSKRDLAMLTAQLPTGSYPIAGIPWYAVPFGRDGLITAWFALEFNPDLMKGVLLYLAQHQAQKEDPIYQAQPGKIQHEIRRGETSRGNHNPFGGYYGGVDTTLLFVMMAGEYWRRTGDAQTIQVLWPHIDLALNWISAYGENKNGFVVYTGDPGEGLANQGWKDSYDAIFDENGSDLKGAIALCEVQGYAYAAWRTGQAVAGQLGFHARAEFCRQRAERLYRHFNEVFWLADKGAYAKALYGEEKISKVMASNMGHLACCGIVSPERAQSVIDHLMGPKFFTGWGIRTLAEGEVRYNPASYHNGSIWPHDTAIACLGAQAMGAFGTVRKVSRAMLETAEAFGSMPELFCAYPRKEGCPPIGYGSSDPKHSWAAAVAFAQVQMALGLRIDAVKSEIQLNPSGLPPEWAPLTIHDLAIGDGRISLRIEQNNSEMRVRVIDQNDVSVLIRDGRGDMQPSFSHLPAPRPLIRDISDQRPILG